MGSRRKRNPGLTDDLVIVGVVAALGFIGYHALKASLPTLPQVAGDAAASAASAANQAWFPVALRDRDLFDAAVAWRYVAEHGILGTGIGRTDPNDWQGFRSYVTWTTGSDPGATQPSWWYGFTMDRGFTEV